MSEFRSIYLVDRKEDDKVGKWITLLLHLCMHFHDFCLALHKTLVKELLPPLSTLNLDFIKELTDHKELKLAKLQTQGWKNHKWSQKSCKKKLEGATTATPPPAPKKKKSRK